MVTKEIKTHSYNSSPFRARNFYSFIQSGTNENNFISLAHNIFSFAFRFKKTQLKGLTVKIKLPFNLPGSTSKTSSDDSTFLNNEI